MPPKSSAARAPGPALAATVPPDVGAKLSRAIVVSLEAVLATEDRKRGKTKLSTLVAFVSAAVRNFLDNKFSSSDRPKICLGNLLAAPNGNHFGIRVRLVCTQPQADALWAAVGPDGFVTMGILGDSGQNLRMLLRQRGAPSRPPSVANEQREFWLQLGRLPLGFASLELQDVAAVLCSAGLHVLAQHPVRAGSLGTISADSLVVVVRSSQHLSGHGTLHLSGLLGRPKGVTATYAVLQYPALPSLYAVWAKGRPAATPDSSAPVASHVAAAKSMVAPPPSTPHAAHAVHQHAAPPQPPPKAATLETTPLPSEHVVATAAASLLVTSPAPAPVPAHVPMSASSARQAGAEVRPMSSVSRPPMASGSKFSFKFDTTRPAAKHPRQPERQASSTTLSEPGASPARKRVEISPPAEEPMLLSAPD